MTQEIYLTGITTTGRRTSATMSAPSGRVSRRARTPQTKNFYFLADYHALAKNEDPDKIGRSTLEIAAAWMALGLDTEHAYFYRQSDIPEIPELTWMLTA